jgi:hypothetical protein
MSSIESMNFERFRHFYPFESKDEKLTFTYLFECEEGWANLIWTLHVDLEKLHKKAKRDSHYVGLQIIRAHRTASGGLLLEEVGASPEMKERIKKAEKAAVRTCEVCGATGQPVQMSGKVLGNIERIVRTLCIEHAQERGFEPLGDDVARAAS